MTYRNSLRRGPPKKSSSESKKPSTASASRKSARTAPATRGEEENEEAHEPTGLTSDEGSGSGSDSDDSSEEEEPEEDGSESESAADDDSDVFEPSASEQEVEEDDDDIISVASEDIDTTPKAKKRGGVAKARDAPPAKKRRKEEPEDEEEIELAPGQKIIGRIYPAPSCGWGRPGQISTNTMDFLRHMQYPKYNNREWFKSHDPWFRRAEKEYFDFVQVMEVKFNEADDELPVLPPRDICHRIYRDVRFSSDKTPYKAHLGLTYGRAGRRGIWAAYHVYLEPGGHSAMACGLWQPEKDILANIRQRILSNPDQLRSVVSRPEFVKMFGPAKPHPQGKRQNIFGHNDELKVAPKGYDKTHPLIDWLRLRSITVVRRFSDDEVLDPHFVDKLKETCAVMRPFVHCLNDMISPEEDEDL